MINGQLSADIGSGLVVDCHSIMVCNGHVRDKEMEDSEMVISSNPQNLMMNDRGKYRFFKGAAPVYETCRRYWRLCQGNRRCCG